MARRPTGKFYPGLVLYRWTFLFPHPSDTKKYRCRCECGREQWVRHYNVSRGVSTQCRQCAVNQTAASKRAKCNIEPGSKWGRWTVIREIPHNRKYIFYLCRCDCGTETPVVRQGLIHGRSTMCNNCVNEQRKGSGNGNWRGYEGIPQRYWGPLKASANGRSIDFLITIEFAWSLYNRQNGRCALSGVPIHFKVDGCDECTASLDRIDSDLPYAEGNVQWVHKDVNWMKNRFSQDAFVRWCRLITEHNFGPVQDREVAA